MGHDRCALATKSTARGERTRIEIGAYAVPPYVYVMNMESLVPTRGFEHHAIFLDALRTVTTLPAPGTGRVDRATMNGEALSHWAE